MEAFRYSLSLYRVRRNSVWPCIGHVSLSLYRVRLTSVLPCIRLASGWACIGHLITLVAFAHSGNHCRDCTESLGPYGTARQPLRAVVGGILVAGSERGPRAPIALLAALQGCLC